MKNLLNYRLQESEKSGYYMLVILLQYPPGQPIPTVPPERTDPPKPPEHPGDPAKPERTDPPHPPEQPEPPAHPERIDPPKPPEHPDPAGGFASHIHISHLHTHFRFCFLAFYSC